MGQGTKHDIMLPVGWPLAPLTTVCKLMVMKKSTSALQYFWKVAWMKYIIILSGTTSFRKFYRKIWLSKWFLKKIWGGHLNLLFFFLNIFKRTLRLYDSQSKIYFVSFSFKKKFSVIPDVISANMSATIFSCPPWLKEITNQFVLWQQEDKCTIAILVSLDKFLKGIV